MDFQKDSKYLKNDLESKKVVKLNMYIMKKINIKIQTKKLKSQNMRLCNSLILETLTYTRTCSEGGTKLLMAEGLV